MLRREHARRRQQLGQLGEAARVGTDPSGGDGHVTWYVETDDLQASLDEAESLGGRTVMPPTEGHLVGLVKPGPPPER